MAKNIVYDYEKMRTVVTQIKDMADEFKGYGETFDNDFDSVTSKWEGESHDQMLALIHGQVKEYLQIKVPGIITALAELLDAEHEEYARHHVKDYADKVCVHYFLVSFFLNIPSILSVTKYPPITLMAAKNTATAPRMMPAIRLSPVLIAHAATAPTMVMPEMALVPLIKGV